MGMSELSLEIEEQYYDDCANSGQMEKDFLEALWYIDEFRVIVENEDDYADLISAENKIIEYQKIYIKDENNTTDETRLELEELKNSIIAQSQLLEKLLSTIPISEKKMITVKDFELHYSIPEETQSRMRGKRKDPLPHTQFSARGNIYYDPKEVDKWMENYKKERR